MKGFIIAIALVAVVGVGFFLIRRKMSPVAPIVAKPATPAQNGLQKLESAISSKTGIPLKAVGNAAGAAESKLWNSGTAGKIGAVALAPILEPTALLQKAVDHPGQTAKAVAHSLQTGAVNTGKAAVGALKSAGSGVAGVGKKILSIF